MLDNQGYKHTLRICEYLPLFHCNNGYANAPQSYITRTLPVLWFMIVCSVVGCVWYGRQVGRYQHSGKTITPFSLRLEVSAFLRNFANHLTHYNASQPRTLQHKSFHRVPYPLCLMPPVVHTHARFRTSAEAFVLIGCCAAQVGGWLPTFRNNIGSIFKGQAVQFS